MKNENGKLYYGIGLDNDQLRSDARNSRNIIKGIGDSTVAEGARIDNSFKKIGAAATAAFSIIAIKQFGMQLIDITGKFQTFEAVLTNTLQSPVKAKHAMDMIQDFAATTPFQVDALTGAFVKLANQGFVPTYNQMEKLGDLASSTGKGFDQLAEAMIDAQTGEFERLKEFGIRASKDGDKVTFTFKEQKTQVDFTNSAIRDYILSLGDLNGVAGSNAEIAKTLSGQYSNLQDTITQAMNGIGDSSKGMLSSTLSGTATLVEHYEEIGRVLGVLIVSYGTYRAAIIAYAVSQKIAMASGNIKAFFDLAKGIKTAKEAQIALNLALGANPFVKLASILLTVGGLIWAFAKNTKEATEELSGLDKAMKSAGDEFEKEASKIQTLQDIMNNGNVAYDERKKALNEIKAIIPNYNAELTTEGILINNNTEAIKDYIVQLERQILLKAIQEEKEDAIRSKRQTEKLIKNQEKVYQQAKDNIPDVVYGGDAGIQGQRYALNNADKAEKELKRLKNELDVTNKSLSELDEEFVSTSNNMDKGDKSVKSFSEQLQSAALRVTTLKKELKQLKAGNGNEEDFAKSIKNKQEELAQAEHSYNTLLGVDKKYLKEKETAFEKTEQDIKDMQLKSLKDFLSDETALKRKQITDNVKLIEFDRDLSLSAIEEERLAYVQLAIAAKKGKTEEDIDTSSFDKRKEIVTQSSDIDIAKENKSRLEKMQSDYAVYAEKLVSIEQWKQDTVDKINSNKNLSTDEKEVRKKQTEEVAAFDFTQAATQLGEDAEIITAGLNPIIENIVKQGLDTVRAQIPTLQKELERLNESGADPAKVAAAQAELSAALKTMDFQIGKLSESSEKSGEVMKTSYTKALVALTDVEMACDIIGDSFGDMLGEAGTDALNVTRQVASSTIGLITMITTTAWTGAEAIKGIEKASVILAVIGAAIQIIMAIVNVMSKYFSKNAKTQSQIDESAARVDILAQKYNNLERAIKKALGRDYYQGQIQLIKNLTRQIDEYETQIALKQAQINDTKKKKKKKKYQEELNAIIESSKEAQDQIDELWQGFYDDLIGTDLKGFSESLAGSLIDGFADGLSDMSDIFNDAFDDLVKGMIKKQLSMDLQKGFIETFNKIKQALSDGDQTFDEAELATIKLQYETDKAAAEKKAEEYRKLLESLGLTDDAEQQAEKKGFAAMSQDTGDELNGRFTAIQMSTTSIDINVDQIKKINKELHFYALSLAENLNILVGISENQLLELRVISSNTSALKETNKRLQSIENNTSRL